MTQSVWQQLHSILATKNLTLAVAESLTGGMVSARFSEMPGSSAYLLGALVAYHNDVKMRMLGVAPDILQRYSPVSEPCARQMAESCRDLFGADLSLSLTGLAGPAGDESFPNIPIGTVFIAVADARGTQVFHEIFPDSGRAQVRGLACESAAQHLLRRIS